MTPTRTFPVIEVFGPVIQGEGAMIGRQTHFVRLGGCDYRCVWCDTLYAVLPEEVRANQTPMTAEGIVDRLLALSPSTPWVTLSGGNPALHPLEPLVIMLKEAGYQIAVETQGSIFRSWLTQCDLVTVSPKPPSSGMAPDLAQLHAFTDLPGANFKVVVFDEADFAFARTVHCTYPTVPFYVQVGNDVRHDTVESLLRKLDWLIQRTVADPAMADTVVLPQLHVLLYGNRRGV